MNTKSKIQLIAEEMEMRNIIFKDLQSLVESYDLSNSIIVYEHNEGTFKFLKQGYAQFLKQNIDIKEAFENININENIPSTAIYFGKNNIPSLMKISTNKANLDQSNPIYEIN